MREDLLGYLLGALEPDEMQRISEALQVDPQLREELQKLSDALRPLDEAHDLYEPPKDLLDRTLSALPPGPPPAADEVVSEEISAQPPLGTSLASTATGKGAVPVSLATAENVGWSWLDATMTTAVTLILACVVLPGILRQRASARTEACQSQLREAGIGLVHYSARQGNGRFPHLEAVGPEAFAGVHAVRMYEQGLLQRRQPLWCPSLDRPEELANIEIPTTEQLYRLSAVELELVQRAVGGHYAYSLGVHDRGLYKAPKFQGRSYFAILADAPTRTLRGWQMAHDGRGCNILFEDGHVAFVADWDANVLGDHLFLNRNGDVEAGLDPDDVTLGSSGTPPFMPIMTDGLSVRRR